MNQKKEKAVKKTKKSKSTKKKSKSKKKQLKNSSLLYPKTQITQNSPKQKITLQNFPNKPYYFKSHTSLNSNSKSRILNEIVNEIPFIDNNCSDLSVTNLSNSEVNFESLKKKKKNANLKLSKIIHLAKIVF